MPDSSDSTPDSQKSLRGPRPQTNPPDLLNGVPGFFFPYQGWSSGPLADENKKWNIWRSNPAVTAVFGPMTYLRLVILDLRLSDPHD